PKEWAGLAGRHGLPMVALAALLLFLKKPLPPEFNKSDIKQLKRLVSRPGQHGPPPALNRFGRMWLAKTVEAWHQAECMSIYAAVYRAWTQFESYALFTDPDYWWRWLIIRERKPTFAGFYALYLRGRRELQQHERSGRRHSVVVAPGILK